MIELYIFLVVMSLSILLTVLAAIWRCTVNESEANADMILRRLLRPPPKTPHVRGETISQLWNNFNHQPSTKESDAVNI